MTPAIAIFLAELIGIVVLLLLFHERGWRLGYKRGIEEGHKAGKDFGRALADNWWIGTEQQKSQRPHCPECRSSIEQLGVWRSESPLWLAFCSICGCTLGSMPRAAELEAAPHV
jgi:ribosomal protein L37AE/L43A